MRILSTLMAVLGGLLLLGRFRRRRGRPIAIPGFDFAGMSQARYQMGGDYHDIFVPPGKGSMAVVVGDVAGHDPVARG